MRRFVIPFKTDEEHREIIDWLTEKKIEIVHRDGHLSWDDEANRRAIVCEAIHIRTQNRKLQMLLQLRFKAIGADKKYFEQQKKIHGWHKTLTRP